MTEPEPTANDTTAQPLRPMRVDAAAVAAALRRTAGAEAPWLHQEVARRMASRLDIVRLRPERIIDWWAHFGGGAPLLRKAYPGAEVIEVEAQPLIDSIEAASGAKRMPLWQRVFGAARPRRVREADFAAVASGASALGQSVPAPAQLLWSNMALHWVDDLPGLFARWHAATTVDGFLMFSCFGPDTLKELRALYAALGFGPPCASFVDMHDIGDELVHAGFADPVMDMEMITLTWPDAASLLQELRTLGGNASPARAPGLRTPRWHKRLSKELTESLGQPDGRLALTFEIVYGHAFRPVPRAVVRQTTEIPLDAMRDMVRRRER